MLAPPRLIRPPRDGWAVSATMPLLDDSQLPFPSPSLGSGGDGGDVGRDKCSDALCEALGWSTPARASVLCAQLMELGRLNPVVRTCDVVLLYSHLFMN
jgi:hypothetical protein